jgi:DNA polymerase
MSANDPLERLRWLIEAGNDEAVVDEPVNRLKAAAEKAKSQPEATPKVSRPQEVVDLSEQRPRAVRGNAAGAGLQKALDPIEDGLGRAFASAEQCTSLLELRQALEAFQGSRLKRNAKRTVFADGNPESGILFIGEAPGYEEDQTGLPFVGRAGKLLDLMMAAIGLDRRSAYIINVLPWRPPDNRNPEATEVAQCIPFLRRHIELALPEIIVLLGAVPVRHVLGFSEGIMKCRGRWADYRIATKSVPVMPTLHPAYLLRQPAHKKLAWRDFQEIAERIAFLQLRQRRETLS